MFLFQLSSLEIGLLAGGGAILLAVIVVLVVLLCRQHREKKHNKSKGKSPRQKRRLQQSSHHHSTIDLPPLVYMEGVGASKTNVVGMIENPLNTFSKDGGNTVINGGTLKNPEWKSFDSLGVPRSPREFMYYMRTLEQSRSNSNSPATPRKENDDTSEADSGIYDVKMFSSTYRESSARKDVKTKPTGSQSPPRRNTSGALRHPAYREMMQGNSFHVVCTTPCTDFSDSDSEPELSSPKARLKFTTIMEEHSGSTSSALNVVSRTEMHPTYHESKQASNTSEKVSAKV